jgi:hypothetical protein
VKVKYVAPAALLAWAAVVGWVVSMVVAKPVERLYGDETDGSATAAELQLAVARNSRALDALKVLTAVDGDASVEPLLAIAPPLSPEQLAVEAANAKGSGQAFEHKVTMVVSVPGSRRAIVDGNYVAVGSKLADGTHVRGIGADWVLLEDVTGQRRIDVHQAFAADHVPPPRDAR